MSAATGATWTEHPWVGDGRRRIRFGVAYGPQLDSSPDWGALVAFVQAAEALGLDWELLPLAVKFANPGEPPAAGMLLHEEIPNLHGRTRLTCTLCGECDVGCNYGAKNTLDYTHLSAVARRENAEIRTLCEVKSFAPRPEGGFTIEYSEHDPKSPSKKDGRELSPRRTITADRLILFHDRRTGIEFFMAVPPSSPWHELLPPEQDVEIRAPEAAA